MRRSIVNFLLLVAVIIFIYLAYLSFQVKRFLYTPMLAKNDAPVVIEVKPGTSLITLAYQLKDQNLIQNVKYFLWLARLQDGLNKIKAGEYLIRPGLTTPAKLLSNFINGKYFYRQVTIVEGWNFRQTMNAINSNPYLTHTLAGLTDEAIMAKLGYPGVNPEGRFYPDTYLFNKGTPDSKILRIAYNTMQKTLQQQWNQRAANLPFRTPDEALTAASLIEEETAVDSERTQIAGVIVRRIEKNMRLQIDPTVIYAMGNAYQGKLTTRDLKIDSPYNTYLYKGLPPGPIAMPSAASIYAALHPAAGDALYYVAAGNGGHVFSATLKAHDQAIVRYLLGPKLCVAPSLLLVRLQNLNTPSTLSLLPPSKRSEQTRIN